MNNRVVGCGFDGTIKGEYALTIVMPTNKAWITKLLDASLVEWSKGKYASTTMMMGMNMGIRDVLSSQFEVGDHTKHGT